MKNRTKTVTRRNGWKFLKPGEIVMAVEKCQGLKKGEKIKKIHPIKIIDVMFEPLNNIDDKELIKEGFSDYDTFQFIEMFVKSHKGINPSSIITRIEFEHLDLML
jgi:hypothetical protein